MIDNSMVSNTVQDLHDTGSGPVHVGNKSVRGNTYVINNYIDLTTDAEDEIPDEAIDLEQEIPSDIIDLTHDSDAEPSMGRKRARDWDSDGHESKRPRFPDDDTSECPSEFGYDGEDSVDEDEHCEDGEDYASLFAEDDGEENSDKEYE